MRSLENIRNFPGVIARRPQADEAISTGSIPWRLPRRFAPRNDNFSSGNWVVTKILFLSSLFFLPTTLVGEGSLHQWEMVDDYTGAYPTTALKLKFEIPILMRQTMIDMSVRCGLRFEDGWRYPLRVQFADGVSGGSENVLASVQLERSSNGDFRQMLNVNVAAYEKDPFNFPKVFAHEIVHAMLNDSLGEGASNVPIWFHEGLAVYGANQGEQMMQSYVFRYPTMAPNDFINGLEGPHGALDYLEDYLAIQYLKEHHGVTGLRNFLEEIARRGGDLSGAYEYTCNRKWGEFLAGAKTFSIDEITEMRRSTRGLATQPGKTY